MSHIICLINYEALSCFQNKIKRGVKLVLEKNEEGMTKVDNEFKQTENILKKYCNIAIFVPLLIVIIRIGMEIFIS